MMSIFVSVLWLVTGGPLWELYRTGFIIRTLYRVGISVGFLWDFYQDLLSPPLEDLYRGRYPLP